MINLHKYTQENCGLEALQLLQLWENCVKRDSDYKNHTIFTLRCISKGIVPASVRLTSACSKISKEAKEIIKKAGNNFYKIRVRCINAIIEDNGNNINKCRSSLASLVSNTTDIDKCSKFIDKVRKDRFFKVRDRQINKFNRLDGKSNNKSCSHNNQVQATGNSNNTNSGNNQLQQENHARWVINLSKTPLTKGQDSLLAKGPNFAIAPNKILNIDCITAVESMCHRFKEEDAGQLRAYMNSLLRRAQVPKPNLSKQESIGLAQLKKDKDRVVLTADKGVAVVVMDKEDYIQKAESLLHNLLTGP